MTGDTLTRKKKEAFDIASKVMLLPDKQHLFHRLNYINSLNYIKFSIGDNFAVDAPVALKVMQRSDEPCLFHRLPGSNPGWGATAPFFPESIHLACKDTIKHMSYTT